MPGRKADDAYQITWLIRRLFRAMGQKSNESLEDLGITAADRAVMEFLYREASLSVPEIARRYQVTRQHVQVTVNPLLEKKILTANENPRHRRSPLISLTSKGRTLFDKIGRRDDAIVARVFKDISLKDRAITRKTLEKLYRTLS